MFEASSPTVLANQTTSPVDIPVTASIGHSQVKTKGNETICSKGTSRIVNPLASLLSSSESNSGSQRSPTARSGGQTMVMKINVHSPSIRNLDLIAHLDKDLPAQRIEKSE